MGKYNKKIKFTLPGDKNTNKNLIRHLFLLIKLAMADAVKLIISTYYHRH